MLMHSFKGIKTAKANHILKQNGCQTGIFSFLQLRLVAALQGGTGRIQQVAFEEKRQAQQKRGAASPPALQRSQWEASLTLIFSLSLSLSIYLPPWASLIYWLVLDHLWPPDFFSFNDFKHTYKCSLSVHTGRPTNTSTADFPCQLFQVTCDSDIQQYCCPQILEYKCINYITQITNILTVCQLISKFSCRGEMSNTHWQHFRNSTISQFASLDSIDIFFYVHFNSVPFKALLKTLGVEVSHQKRLMEIANSETLL